MVEFKCKSCKYEWSETGKEPIWKCPICGETYLRTYLSIFLLSLVILSLVGHMLLFSGTIEGTDIQIKDCVVDNRVF